MRTWIPAALGALTLAQSARAQLPREEACDALRAEYDAIVAAPALANARVGFVLREVGDAPPLVEERATEGFLPASNLKLVSSAVALDVLGPEYRFETKLVGFGRLLREQGAFEGDLVLVGSGDPTLGALAFEKSIAAPFERAAAALAEVGVRAIHGDVIGDDSCQPDEIMGLGWDWSYHADWYAAQVSGLCFNENCFDLVLAGAEVGKPPTFRLEPETSYVSIENAARCVESGPTELVFGRALGTNLVRLTGTFPSGVKHKRDWGSVENPTRFAATVLRETLVRAGIDVRGRARDLDEIAGYEARGAEHVFWVQRSPPMREILVSLNKRSQNLYAEQVVRAAARARGGDGSMKSARACAREVLARLGVRTQGMFLADGSGLSRLDVVQPRQIAGLLAAMARHEHAALFVSTLPVAGVDGTLAKRFPAGHPARGRVRAKTGYVARVVALSGYVERAGRTPLVFSILVNDFHAAVREVKVLVDRLVGKICELAPEARGTGGDGKRE